MLSAVCAYSRTTAGAPPISPNGSSVPSSITDLRGICWVRSIYLLRAGAADHRGHRVALVLDPLGQAVGLDLGEAGVAQVVRDELGVPGIVKRSPDRHRLGPEAAVREADSRRAAGPQHPRALAQDLDRALQILDRDADHRRVDAVVR